MDSSPASLPEIAGMVTIYNSEQKVVENISTYISQVKKLYVVDNSEILDDTLIRTIVDKYPTVEYITNGGNKGIAYALNAGALAAVRDKYNYLLMMDDDSETPGNLVDSLYSTFTNGCSDKIGIVSAQSDTKVDRESDQDVITTITSGSLLSLNAYKAVGPFLNELFIDWVDHEYCFRLRRNGYRIIVVNKVKLSHRLGILKTKSILNIFEIKWRSHSPTRLYYKFRNSIFVLDEYKKQLPFSFVVSVYYELLRDILKAIFVEKDKVLYLSHIKRGLVDAYRHNLGKYVR